MMVWIKINFILKFLCKLNHYIGYYDDGVNDLCLICDRTCLTCNDRSNNNCLSCKINRILTGT
jgi:hypothetical protein